MNLKETITLPAHYYPFASGEYSTAPGLHKLTTDFGNGEADQRIFQIDNQWNVYRQNKHNCHQEGIGKYFKTHKLKENTARELTTYLVHKLQSEYPSIFKVEKQRNDLLLTNHLSQETIRFDQNFRLVEGSEYFSAFDTLASQVQEDMAIWQMEGKDDWISMIHLCAPNHWSPADKIGKPFSVVHQPVAGMERMRQRYQPMLKTLIRSGSFVRFAWGLSTDNRLNHHSEPPLGVVEEDWRGRSFDSDNPVLFVRVERQTLSGFPETNAVLFTIRTYFEEVSFLNAEQLYSLKVALASMSSESLQYKGLENDSKAILTHLQRLITKAKV